MTIYQAMAAIDGVRSYMYVRADNMSQAFDCALMRTHARNPQSYVEVLTAQELREPVDVYIRHGRGIPNSYRRSAWRLLTTQLLCILTLPAASSALEPWPAWPRSFSQRRFFPRVAVN